MIDSVSAAATANYSSPASRFEPPPGSLNREDEAPPNPAAGAAGSAPASDTREKFVSDRVEQVGRSELGPVPQESPVLPPYLPFYENIESLGAQKEAAPPPVDDVEEAPPPQEGRGSQEADAPDESGSTASSGKSEDDGRSSETGDQQAKDNNAAPTRSVQDLVLKLYDLPA